MEELAKDAKIEILLQKLFCMTAARRKAYVSLFKNRLRSNAPDYDKLWDETLRRPESIAWLNEQAAKAHQRYLAGESMTLEEFLERCEE